MFFLSFYSPQFVCLRDIAGVPHSSLYSPWLASTDSVFKWGRKRKWDPIWGESQFRWKPHQLDCCTVEQIELEAILRRKKFVSSLRPQPSASFPFLVYLVGLYFDSTKAKWLSQQLNIKTDKPATSFRLIWKTSDSNWDSSKPLKRRYLHEFYAYKEIFLLPQKTKCGFGVAKVDGDWGKALE